MAKRTKDSKSYDKLKKKPNSVAGEQLGQVGKAVGDAVKAVVVDPISAVAAPWKHQNRDWWMKRDFWATGTNPKKLKKGQEVTDAYQELTDIRVPKGPATKTDRAVERAKRKLKRYHKKLDRAATSAALKKLEKKASNGVHIENLYWPKVTGPPKLTAAQKARIAPAWQRKAFSKIHGLLNGPKFSNRTDPLNVYHRQQRSEMNALMKKHSSVDDTTWTEQMVAQFRHLFLTQPDRILDDTTWMDIKIPNLWDKAQIMGALKEKHANAIVPATASNTRNVTSVSTNVSGMTNKAMSKLKKSTTGKTTMFKMPKPKTQADLQVAGGPAAKKTQFGAFKPVVGNASRNLGIGGAMSGKNVGPQAKLIT